MQALLGAIKALNGRVEWLLRKLDDLTARVRNAEQRIREISQLGGEGGGGDYGPQAALTNISVFQATSSISARSGTTPGSGTATRFAYGGSTIASDGETGVPVRNILNKTIATSSYLICGQDRTGWWWVLAVGDCANLS